ncbi:hypothetical protein ACFFUR_06215 [Echinicola jeungdonensis]|uniref:Uncharacterized protein n=1 Tax=Echinicola jeungdonensis TaxID=709343 RepID=A0ABV5J3W5_9BACT
MLIGDLASSQEYYPLVQIELIKAGNEIRDKYSMEIFNPHLKTKHHEKLRSDIILLPKGLPEAEPGI